MAKQEKNDRQAKLDAIRKQQKSAARRGNVMIIGVASALALLIIVAAAWKPVTDSIDRKKFSSKDFASIGAKADVCGEVITREDGDEGVSNHVEPGTPIDYPDAPPAYGQHFSSWDTNFDRKFYSDDRPDLGYLVHNLEHGYTVLWYDETIAGDADKLATVKGLAAKFDGNSMRNKFKAVPWTKADGEAFPKDQHVAFTHWSKGGQDNTDIKTVGVWQYCSEPSGAALEKFMKDYPYMDSPEPEAG
ncbi:DUF3105 domain-containing protein [Nocardioides yefusunii]|uniref:DUF3105 domain-containing protein n=1 Tax=Nocardioides yefusunii TaxID=2500546 RepID=A0ABW1R2Z0_9ACTN|nr:DUF3105 domain-containing protein [Nocardioides yefusunii]